MLKAVIFDMDGVLVDSEKEYLRMWKKYYYTNGIDISEEELRTICGSPHSYEIELLARKAGICYEKAAKLRSEYLNRNKIDYRKIKKPHVDEILTYIRNQGLKTALASTSTYENINAALNECEIADRFDFIISGEMFKRSKPDPQIYETTVRKLGCSKKEVLVIEDSDYGIQAAKAAGLTVIAIDDPVLKFDNHLADYIVKDLAEAKEILKEHVSLNIP